MTLDGREIDALFRLHSPLVYRRALRLLKSSDDARDATQEVFIKLVKNAHRLDTERDILPWLFRLTTNYCLNLLRDRGRRSTLLQAHVAPRATARVAARQHDLVTLRWLLSSADQKQARAAVYVYLDGMSYDEAAEVMQVSRRTLANQLKRFKAWAAKQLATRPGPGGHHD